MDLSEVIAVIGAMAACVAIAADMPKHSDDEFRAALVRFRQKYPDLFGSGASEESDEYFVRSYRAAKAMAEFVP